MKVEPPLNGISEDRSFAEQEPGTTREARNTRSENPLTQRQQISQRSGMSDFSTLGVAVAGAFPVRLATDLTYDVPVLDYADISDANLSDAAEWKVQQSQRSAHRVVVDSQGASYWIFGKDTLQKISADGVVVWTFSVPLLEETHLARALAIDGFGNIYVGSAADQDYSDSSFAAIPMQAVQENNRIWRIAQISKPEDDTEEAQLAGEWGAGGFVEDLAVRNGFLHYIQNRSDRYVADLVTIRDFGVDSGSLNVQPSILSQRIVPYPANSIAVNSLGEVIVASEPFTDRLVDPKYPNLSRVSNLSTLPGMWTWRRNLDNPAGRGWAEIDPANLGQVNGTIVTAVPDSDGLGRGFKFASSIAGDARVFTEPTYVERALGDAPGVRFNGVDNGLQSERNLTTDYRDRGGAMQTPWPSYGSYTGVSPNKIADPTCAGFAVFMVVRLPTTGSKGAIIGQASLTTDQPTATIHTRCPFAIVANRGENESTAVATEAGKISVYDWIRESAGDFLSNYTPSGPLATAGDVRFPREGDLLGVRAAPNDSADPEDPPIALLSLVIDNAIDPGAAHDLKTRATWRLNGRPIDRWEGSVRISEEPVTLGFAANLGGDTNGTPLGQMEGDFIRFLCLAKPDPLDSTQPTIIETPQTSPNAKVFNIFSTATSGNFTGTFHYPDGTADETTGNMAFNATAAQVEAAFEALPGLGTAFEISVTGTAVNAGGGVFVYIGWNESVAKPTDTGTYYGIDLPIFDINDVSLAGGTVVASLGKDIDGGVGGTTQAHGALTKTELELIEGQLAHEYGIQHLFPQPNSLLPGVPAEPFFHPYAVYPPVDPDAVDPTLLFSTSGILAKFSTGDLSLVWVESPSKAVGFGVALDQDDDIYSLGYHDTVGGGSNEQFAKYIDSGDSVALDFDTFMTIDDFVNRHPKMAVDEYKTVYIPRSTTGSAESVRALDSVGAQELIYDVEAGAEIVRANAVAVAPQAIDYGATVITRSEFLYVASDNAAPLGTVNYDTARKVRLVSVTHSGRSPRVTERIVVSNGDVKMDDGAGGYVTISGGASAIDASSPLVMGVRHQGKLYINDQKCTFVYDPKELTGDKLTLLKATDGGMIPQRAHFLFSWRGKLGWARLDDQPGFIQLARSAKPTELNITPNPLFPGRAWKGSSSLDIGDAPDIINSVAPLSNTLLAIFGDKSIHLLQGEPTFGGQLTEAAHMIGGAYGKCWAWDGEERLFFMSNFGEVYLLPLGGLPQKISSTRIKRMLRDIDFSTHYVNAEWNWLDETVHFFLIPYSSVASVVSHFVLDTKRGRLAFWEDTFDLSRQPTCVGIFDGDSQQDQRMVLGQTDGHVRTWDPAAKDDDGMPIDFSVIYPLTPSGSDTQFSFSELRLLLEHDEDGCFAELIPAEHPGSLDEELKSPPIEFRPGYNSASSERRVGNFMYLRIRNSAPDSRCSIQEVMVNAKAVGARRPQVTS